MYPHWLSYVDSKRQHSLLQILQLLSVLQTKDKVNFITIGALPLLVAGYLQYSVYWDIDLLFKDEESLKEFIKRPKSETLKIVDYDDALMVSKNIASFHTAWAFDRIWFNVDYILRKGFFEFYTHKIKTLMPYTESLKEDDTHYEISLYLAHPWDIIVEKVVSPRAERDIELKIDTSIDIRHIFAVYKKEKNNMQFWRYIFEKTELLCTEQKFKAQFLKILSAATDLGYNDLEISATSLQMLKST